MKEEVEKLTDDGMERIALTDTIISSLYHSGQLPPPEGGGLLVIARATVD